MSFIQREQPKVPLRTKIAISLRLLDRDPNEPSSITNRGVPPPNSIYGTRVLALGPGEIDRLMRWTSRTLRSPDRSVRADIYGDIIDPDLTLALSTSHPNPGLATLVFHSPAEITTLRIPFIETETGLRVATRFIASVGYRMSCIPRGPLVDATLFEAYIDHVQTPE